jgi:lipopolysaccharide transport system permease protein
MTNSKNVIYTSDKYINLGLIAGWKDMSLALFQSRELIWRLFLRDFSAKYRQSLFGVLWAVLNPVMIIGVFIFLNRSGIININETTIPYSIYALIGISFYSLFSTGLASATSSIVGAGPMVVKINFPKISLVVSSFGTAVVEFGVRFVLIAALVVYYGILPQWQALLLPLLVIPLILITLGVGFITALLAGVFRDTVHVISLFTTFFLFATPVLYPAPQAGIFADINKWNPLSHIITGCRDILITGSMNNIIDYCWSAAISLVLFLVSWRIFYLSETRIAERV